MADHLPIKVVSGAQIGADIAGLRAGFRCGRETGGHMPKGWRTKNGPLPADDVLKYRLQETDSDKYPARTELNVFNSDGTIQLAYQWNSPGERLTTKLVRKYGKPNHLIHCFYENGGYSIRAHEDETAEWIISNNIRVLNVAGNADEAIEMCVEMYLIDVFHVLET